MIPIVVVTGIVLAVLLLILLSTYNGLMQLRQDVRSAWALMDDTLKQRYDLMPMLISTVQAAGGEPSGKLPAVILAKNQTAVAFNPAQLAISEIALTVAIHDVVAAAEREPALHSDPKFAEIRQKLIGSERKIDSSCKLYNDRVNQLNDALGSFPTIFTARAIGLKPQPAFVLPIDQEH
jgi:LemA protein